MKLFVFEGKKTEPYIFDTLFRLFFANAEDKVVCSYDNNIYELYNAMEKLDWEADIVRLIKEKNVERGDHSLDAYERVSDFSEVYLMFDCDFHHHWFPLDELTDKLAKMLERFDNETENGKLFVSYPMVEALRYTKQMVDADYKDYVCKREDCSRFKTMAAEFSRGVYPNWDFICLKANESPNEERMTKLKSNWTLANEQNVKKANWLCHDEDEVPESATDVEQKDIFTAQKDKYIETDHPQVSILSGISLFLYDYFGHV